jgi:formylglycine-generating enzyme
MKINMSRWFVFFLVVGCIGVGPALAADSATGRTTESVNSIGMKMLLVPAGEFLMGGQESAKDLVATFPAYRRPPDFFKDEYPRHRVRITKPFELGKYEVTIGQFRRFTDETGYKTEAEKDGLGGWGYDAATGKCRGRDVKFNWRNPGFKQTDDQPVLDVTWFDATAFCKWLSRKDGRIYRLPTEAEWEYACRAGTTTRYNNGDAPGKLAKVANVGDDHGRTTFPHVQELDLPKDGQVKFTIPVGTFPPNRFGLCDTHGNVWEWCADWYGADYYAHSPRNDPTGPDTGTKRVRRGGAWHSFPLWARASFRNWNSPQSRCVNLGFRVAAEVAETASKGTVPSSPERRPRQSTEQGAVSIVFVGDVMLDGDPGHAIVYGADPFTEFDPIFRQADVAVCNLECVLAGGGQQVFKPFTFRGPKEAIPLLKRHFDAVCLANNHTGDFGQDAFSRQLTMFEEAGLRYFGGGRNRHDARRPLILERNGMRIALLGYNGFPPRSFAAGDNQPGVAWLTQSDVAADIRAARQRAGADIVIPFLHWGRGGSPEPKASQRELARRLIDAGASAVIGAHPHVTQTVDIYRGHPIVYSLGNFVFDYYPADPPVWTGWIAKITFHHAGQIDLETFVLQIDKTGMPHLVSRTDKGDS